MELSFVIAAIRRWWWVPIVGALGGLAAAAVIAGPRQQNFASSSTVAIATPNTAQATADRFVAERIAVLRSRAFLDQVASRASIDPTALRSEVRVTQQPATDLVSIVVTSTDRRRVQALAQTVVNEYIASERRREDERKQVSLASLTAQAAAIQGEIAKLSPPGPADGTSLDVAAQRSRKEQEYREVLDAESKLLSDPGDGLSEVVEPATAPQPIGATRGRLVLIAGLLFGASVGFALATIFARFSRFVVDDASASEILAAPFVVRVKIPSLRSYRGDPPPRWSDAVNILAAQAQSMVALGAPLRVVVVAGQRGAGGTSLCLALAGSLSRTGERVVLVDADDRNPELTAVCTGHARSVPERPRQRGELTSGTSVGPRNAGQGPVVLVAARGALRREAVPALLAKAGSAADLVVVDGGSLLDSAAARQLCQAADAVIFVVGARRQRVDVLRSAALQLNEMTGKLLVASVTVQPPRHQESSAPVPGRRDRHRADDKPVVLPRGTTRV